MALVEVAANWGALTPPQKVALFENAGGEAPTVDDVKPLGKFKIVTYSKGTTQATCSIKATPKAQVILPKEMLNLKQVEDLNKLTITESIIDSPTTGTASPNEIRYAFTIDKTKYYVFKNNDWEEIQTNEIPTKGIKKSEVESIPKAKWKELLTAKETVPVSKLGIAYSIQQRFVADTCAIDAMSMLVDQKGSWKRKCVTYEYNVEYTDSETVVVTLPSAGSYKINYCLG